MGYGFKDDTLNVLIGRLTMDQAAVWEEIKRLEADAMRYRWIRAHGAWETEAFLNGLSSWEYDEAVDKRIAESEEPSQ